MEAKHCLHLGIFLYLAIISETRVIVPRNLGEEIPFSINPLEKDNRLGLKPAVWGPPIDDTEYSDNSGIIDPARPPLINDYEYEPGRDVDKEDNRPGTNPERFPINADREKIPNENPEEKDEIDNSGDDNFINKHDIGDPGKFGNDDKDFKLPPDEEKPINKEGDESEVENTGPDESEEERNDKENKPEDEDEEKPDEEKEEDEDEEKPDEEKEEDEPVEDDNNGKHKPEVEEEPGEEESKDDTNDNEHKPEDEEKPDEERKENEEDEMYEPENDDEKKYVPEEESTDDEKKEASEGSENDKNGDENIPHEGEKGLFSGGSIFDTPFFNLEQVKNYFSKLDRALNHVFRQTLDEALLLNGTYANTTEEEVDIGGKKYIVTKSVLKGADNNSMMYVEALSTKPKMGDPEVVQNTDIKNATSA